MSVINNPQHMLPTGALTPQQLAALGQPSAAAAGPPDQGGGLTAADAWRIVKQRKVLIIATWCIVYVLVVAATFLIYRFAPAYSNEAYVRLIPPVEDWNKMTGQVLPRDYIEQQLQTESQQILSPPLLMDVLALPEIKETKFYQWYENDFEQCLYDFERMLNVAPVRDSYLIRVGIAVQDPKEAKLIVNTVVNRYLQRSVSRTKDEANKRIESLRNTEAAVQAELKKTRDQIRTLRQRRDLPAIEAERDVIVETAAVLNNTLAELRAREADIEAQLSTIRGVDPRNLPLSAEMRMIIDSDPLLRYYRQQVEAMDIQIEVIKRNRVGEQHRLMRELVDSRDAHFQKEVTRREELIEDLRARQVESLGQEIARIRNMMGEVFEQLVEKENAQRDLEEALTEFTNLVTDEERNSKQLEEVGLAMRQSETTLRIQEAEGRLEAMLAARDPYWPSRPNFLIYLGGGFVLSALVGVGLAFLRELTDQAVRTPLDIARYGHISVLGSVPRLDDEQADVEEIELATRQAPHSLVAEAFRQIRAYLVFSGPHESQRVLLITSPRPEDGKSAIAINLAVTFAQSNERVLLIDCNFRRPALRSAFKSTRPDGLSNVLVGQAKLEALVTRTDLANLDVLTAGPMPPNPAELLGSRQMRELLETAKAKYSRVLLDGPPCLLISDALVLATQVDATVLVARAANSAKGALRRARDQLQRVNARVIGGILNGVQARAGGYFRQQYREFYEYTSDEVVPHELPGGLPEIDAGPSDAGERRDA